jgi:putative membrane protein
MKTNFITIGTLSVALAVGGLSAYSAESTKPAAATEAAATQRLAPGDAEFIKKAAVGGMAEVKLGQLAQEKGSSQEVKDFGAKMVADHGKANDELKGIASAKGLEVPADLDAKNQAVYDRLSKLSGSEFDKAYVKDMVRDHKEDVSEFEHASKSLQDPELKGFAEKTLSVIKAHLEHAEQISSESKKGA